MPARRALLTGAAALAATAAASSLAGCDSGGDGGGRRPGGGAGSRGPGTASGSATPTPTPTPSPGAPSWSALAKGLDGDLVRPGDADYPTARQLYNTRYDGLKPAAVAYVSGEADVKECLAFARTHSTPVSVRSGGHSYAGWSSGNGRLVIDVSRLDSLDRSSSEASVGAGARLAGIYRGLAEHGRTIPGGSCPTVAISGLTLGGGHGVTARAYGLACDNLLSATLVTADGRTLTADTHRDSDLFWALRGAGNGNFGVVTELRFRTHPAPDGVVAYMSWPWAKAGRLLATWQEWGPSQPDEIWSALQLDAGPGGVAPTASVSVFSLGTESDLHNAVDRLADQAGGPGPASSVSLRTRSFEDAMEVYGGCSGLTADQCRLPGTTPGRSPHGALHRETYAAASDFYDRSMSAAGRQAMLGAAEAFTRLPAARGGGGSIALTALGGAVNRVAPGATAFVHRGSRMLAQYVASWQPNDSGSAHQAWLRSTQAAMRRYASGAAYQNYVDPTLKDWRTAYYGGAAGRLAGLKKKYDPDRLFDFPQAL
ncbi:FAD-binding oxidoreductase [Streptomyces montanisoli]|uniref:FAD-binding oxidoreductase n=1 Tax=Streptomyces montanisoli TaxID=2798581 RepID=A0A940RZ81_9ACTN|nr:FAD-binding oxidoreductase [Streptomyces montanisoli]MBP0462126.1 FAD-binding oxidoreductase [Streptomyces montanisoli]